MKISANDSMINIAREREGGKEGRRELEERERGGAK